MATAIAVAVSCDPEQGKGDDYSKLTPDENKQKLEDVALAALSKINAQNHETFCSVIDDFIRCTDNSSLNFPYTENSGPSPAPGAKSFMAVLETMRQVAVKGDISGMTSLASPDNVAFRAIDYYGIWTYEGPGKEWSYTESDSKLEFIFPSGQETVHATAAGGKDSVEVTVSGEKYVIPAQMSFSVRLGDEELANATISDSYTGPDGKADVNISVNVADVQATAEISLTSEAGNATAALNIGGEEIVRVTATAAGKGMTDIDGIIDGANAENPEIPVNGTEAEILIMNEVKLYGRCSDINGFFTEQNRIYDLFYNKYGNQSAPYYWEIKEYNDAKCDNFNSYFTFTYGYSPVFSTIASGLMKPAQYERTNWIDNGFGLEPGQKYTAWRSDFVIKFSNDGSEFSIDSYFDGTGFGSLIDEVNKLAEIYEKYMDYCFGE